MRLLSLDEMSQVSAGDGRFRVYIDADVPYDCSAFVSKLHETYLISDMEHEEYMQAIFASEYETQDLDLAIDSIYIYYYA